MNPSLRVLIATVLALFAGLANAQEKTAIIVSTGDLYGQIDAEMMALEQQAIKTYTQLGFVVKVVGGIAGAPSEVSPNAFRQIMKDLKGVRDLRLDFIGHGRLKPSKTPFVQFSATRMRFLEPEVLEPSSSGYDWIIPDKTTAQSGDFGKDLVATGLLQSHSRDLDGNSIVGSFQMFRANNPEAFSMINLFSCYSGSLAMALRKEPRTIVFADSPASEPNLIFVNDRSESFVKHEAMSIYYSKLLLAKGSNPVQLRLSALEESLNKRTIADQSAFYLPYFNGRSPVYESIMGWCETEKVTSGWRNSSLRADWQNLIDKAYQENRQRRQAIEAKLQQPSEGSGQTLEQALASEDSSCRKSQLLRSMANKLGVSVIETADRESYSDRLHKAHPDGVSVLRLLFDKLEQSLVSLDLTQSILTALQYELETLKLYKVSKERLAALPELLANLKSQKLSNAEIRALFLKEVERARRDCAQGDIRSSPCLDHVNSIKFIGESLQSANRHLTRFQVCDNFERPDYFKCIFQRPMVDVHVEDFVRDYWLPGNGLEVFSQDRCNQSIWFQVQRIRSNLRLDERCLQKFKNFAPDEEWFNLERLSRGGI